MVAFLWFFYFAVIKAVAPSNQIDLLIFNGELNGIQIYSQIIALTSSSRPKRRGKWQNYILDVIWEKINRVFSIFLGMVERWLLYTFADDILCY